MQAKTSKPARPDDVFYDPNFIVGSEFDHYKAVFEARMSRANFMVCPIFENMFSDLPTRPRKQIVMRKMGKVPKYEDKRKDTLSNPKKSSSIDPSGAARILFFFRPRSVKIKAPILDLHLPIPESLPSVKSEVCCQYKYNKKIQTKYRESLMQTAPWEPDYIVTDDSDPEILKLDFLKWGAGLPAGMHEVTLIIRARMKRAWEKVMPPVTDEASLNRRKAIIQAIEEDEWRFRDEEIQEIQNLRMELLEKMLNELHEKSHCRSEKKVRDYTIMKNKEKEDKIQKLRHATERALRKLNMQHKGIAATDKQTIASMYIEKSSNVYAPGLRLGKPPAFKLPIVEEHHKRYCPDFKGVEDLNTLPTWINKATEMKDCTCLKLSGTRLCIRETKWTTPILKQLHEELKDLHEPQKTYCSLRKRVERIISEPPTPEIEGIPEWDEESYQAALVLQSIIRGRASHMTVYKGRNRCQELIKELRSTHALQEDDRKKKFNQRLVVKVEQRANQICFQNAAYLKEALNELSGSIVGTLLDFLTKELHRLLDEKRIHAMCLYAYRERNRREAAEAGRRQDELRRREEHNELLKQEIIAHQDISDMFLQDIITEGIDFASDQEAREYVQRLAEKVDEDAYDTLKTTLPVTEQEELVASLIHEFLVPEVDKQIVRDRIKKRQENYLKIAHEEIYSKVDELPIPKRTSALTVLLDPREFRRNIIKQREASLPPEPLPQQEEIQQFPSIVEKEEDAKKSSVPVETDETEQDSHISVNETELKLTSFDEKSDIE